MKNLNKKLMSILFIVFSFIVTSTSFANEYLAETKEIKFTTELVKLAEKLEHDPIKIYNWVYENIEYENYKLARKDALSVYWTKRGNEWDQSTLLITLFRISGIQSRYAVFNDYSLPYHNRKVIVEAYLSLANYRGTNTNSNKNWISLVPWKKDYKIVQGLDLFPNNNIPSELKIDYDDYISSIKQETTVELFERKIQNYLSIYHPSKTLKDVGSEKLIKKKNLPILPFSLPIGVNSSNSKTIYSQIPNEYKIKVIYFIKRNNLTQDTVLEHIFFLSEISSSRVIVDFIPYSSTDKDKIKPHGTITKTPSNVANVKAVIKVDGQTVATSLAFKTGEKFIDAHKLNDESINLRRTKKVGSTISLGFDILNISERFIEKIKSELNNISTDVLNNDYTKEEYLGRYIYILNSEFRLRKYRAITKTTRYLNSERIYYANSFFPTRVYTYFDNLTSSNEKYVIHPKMQIDASTFSGAIKRAGTNNYLDWDDAFSKYSRDIFMYTASYNEGKIFEDWQSTPSANTIKMLMVAKDRGISIKTLTKADVVDGKLNALEAQYVNKHDAGFIQRIIDVLINDNATVIVPAIKIFYEGLTLDGYISFSNNEDSYMFNSNGGGASNDIASYFPTKVESTPLVYEKYSEEFTDSETSSNSETSTDSMVVNTSNEETYSEISPDGDPVNMLTGEFYQEEKSDISLKSTNKNILAVKRTYKSQLDYNGIFGYGWSWSHMDKIIHTDDGNFIYVDNNAKFAKIINHGDGSFTYPKGAKYTIKKVGNNYTVSNFDGSTILFDSNGLLLQKNDRNLNKIIFEYNEKHNISKISDNHGRELLFDYNSNNKVISITDSTGRNTTYSYDEYDLISFTDLEGNTTNYEYLKNQEDSANNHNMSKYILPNGDYLEISYYKNDQVSHHTNKDGNSFNFQYSRYNRYSETWNEEGYYRKIFFNDNGDVVRVDKKDGTLELKTYDENHNMISFTNANGYETRYSYDSKRNLVYKHDAKGGIWRWEYHPIYNKLIKKTDSSNFSTLYEYDEKGNLTKIIDPFLNETTFEYDIFGNQKKITDAYNNFIEKEYDTTGTNLVRSTDKNGNTTMYDYDEVGNQIQITNAKGGIKKREYNYNNQVIKEIDELDNNTIFEYNENKKLIKKILANGGEYEYNYTIAKDIVTGNLISTIIDPIGNKKDIFYDKLGNKIEETDYKGNYTRYTYNELNKISSKTDANGNTIYYRYDGLGNIIKEESKKFVDGKYVDVITTYTYDKAGMLKTKTLPNGLVYHYKYHTSGLLIEEKYSFDSKTYIKQYSYNKLKKLIGISEHDGDQVRRDTTFEYDKLQRKIKEINAEGIVTTFSYDANSNLLEKYIAGIRVEKYIYNELNKVTSKIDANGNTTIYTYDIKGQLVSKIDSLNNIYRYKYNEFGKLKEEIFPTGYSKIYKYNLLNKIEKFTDAENNSKYFEYDENLNLIREIDSRGNSTSYMYNALNQRIRIVDAYNNYLTNSYDEFGNITSEVNEEGDIVEYVYDINNNLIKKVEMVSYNESLETTYTYDSLNRLISISDPKGNITSYSYNIFNELISTTNTLNHKVTNEYDKIGRIVKITDPKGIRKTFEYDNLSRIVKIIQSEYTENEVATEYTYDDVGNKTSEVKDSIITSYIYDKLNRLTQTRVNNKLILSQTYDSIGNIASSTDGKNNTIIYEYNGNNKVVKQIDAKGNSFTFNYDQNNNIILQSTPEGVFVINEYDKLNRLISQSVDSEIKKYAYDKASRVIFETNFNGIITENIYDSLGRVSSKVEAKNTKEYKTTNYKYDKNSNIIEIKDANGNITNFKYDELNRKVKHIYPTGVYQSYIYDENSNLKTRLKEDGTEIENFYDSLNRLVKVEVDSLVEQEYSYDSLSRLTIAKDYNGHRELNSIEYEYDELSNISKSTQNDKIVNTTYDLNSNLQSISADSYEIENSYDELNSLNKVTLNNQEIVNFEYDKDNRLVKTNLSNGISLDIDYDNRSRERNRDYKLNSGTIYSQKTEYDLNSNVVQEDIVNTNESIIKTYEYDSLDRLTKDSYQNHNFQYDKLGNQIYTTQNGFSENREVNGNNEYVDITDTNIEYDEVGNIKSYKDKEFIYDYLNRLVEVKENSQTLATYTYDALNRRVSKTLPQENKTINYVYHKDQIIQEYENNTLANSYVYGEYIDDPIAYKYNSNIYYYIKDRQYSVQAITDGSANVVERYSYNAFGIITIKDQDGHVLSKTDINNSITYTGRRLDSESNLYYYRNRMYSPELARFISKDPKGYVDGMNLYAYVMNNPLKYLDPMGTTARQNFTDEFGREGTVYYSASGRTSDYRVEYNNEPQSSGFGYSSTVGNYNFNSTENMYNYTDSRYGGSETFHQFDSSGETVSYTAYSSSIGNQPANFFKDNIGGQIISATVGDTIAAFSESKVNPLSGNLLTPKEVKDTQFLSIIGALIPSTRATSFVKVVDDVKYFNPINKGPLPENIANTFRSATYEKVTLSENKTFYRVFSDGISMKGSYMTDIKPAGPTQSILDSALIPSWGNNALRVSEVIVPRGTKIYSGIASSQKEKGSSLIGGGNQIFIPRDNLKELRFKEIKYE